jgi:hypothetical protein
LAIALSRLAGRYSTDRRGRSSTVTGGPSISPPRLNQGRANGNPQSSFQPPTLPRNLPSAALLIWPTRAAPPHRAPQSRHRRPVAPTRRSIRQCSCATGLRCRPPDAARLLPCKRCASLSLGGRREGSGSAYASGLIAFASRSCSAASVAMPLAW